MTEKTEICKNIYDLSFNFLINKIHEKGININIDKYLIPKPVTDYSLNDVFRRILISSINRQGHEKIIKFPEHIEFDIEPLKELLFDFTPHIVNENYKEINEKQLLNIIAMTFNIEDITNKTTWIYFCKTILSSAKFLSGFEDFNQIKRLFDGIYNNEYSKNYLPVLLKYNIFGFGIALSCDFLKELGFIKYGKPDVHTKRLLVALNLLEKQKIDEMDFACLYLFDELSHFSNKSQYSIDKLFWLIGTGKLYLENDLDNNIGGYMNEFIELAKREFKIT